MDLVGQELGGFRLEQQLGEGGMATVFRGVNVLNPNIIRAIKVVKPELAGRAEFVKRFALEATALETLQHPNIVRFYGLRREGAAMFMELELLSGRPLSGVALDRLGTPTPPAEAIGWIQQAAEGVAAAHAAGLVHRDLKPENLFLSGGTVKVLDFGIARVADEVERATRATTVGVPGSPPYMAPEVCRGEKATAAADVFALGISLYELLLGYHPLLPPGQEVPTGNRLLFLQQELELAPIRQHRPDAPPLLDDVLAQALEKDPTRRFPDARHFADALRGAMTGAAPERVGRKTSIANLPATPGTGWTPPRTEPVAGRGRVWVAGGALIAVVAVGVGVVALVAGGAAWWYWPRPAPPEVALEAPAPTGPVNAFIRIEPPPGRDPVALGVPADSQDKVKGFRPSRAVVAPNYPYELQAHEVT